MSAANAAVAVEEATVIPPTVRENTAGLPEASPPPAANLTPMQMAYQLIQQGADLGSVKEMLAVSKELAADQARRAFDAALSAAKAEIPVILKNRTVGYDHKDGSGQTSYRHEDMGEIARTVDPILSKHGLSYRFRTSSEIGQPIVVTCIVAHRDGHAEENTLTAGRDDSGKKNALQQVGSTITYLQRYTLKAALGLAAAADDDGKSVGAANAISEEQRAELERMLTEAGASIDEFCAYAKIETLADLPAAKFEVAKQRILNRKKGAGK